MTAEEPAGAGAAFETVSTFDIDDRAPCRCTADHPSAYAVRRPARCGNLTRHPSGYCVDCRLIVAQDHARPAGAHRPRQIVPVPR